MRFWKRTQIENPRRCIDWMKNDPQFAKFIHSIMSIPTALQLDELKEYQNVHNTPEHDARVESYITELFEQRKLKMICNEMLTAAK